MTHNAQWYADKLNALEKQLTPADRDWFNSLREYTTLGAVMHDETAVNAQLYAMMTDLSAAEQDGGDAISFFGKDAQKMADSILKQLPPARWQTIAQLLGIVVGVSWLVMLIGGGLTDGAMTINLLSYLAVAALSTAMVVIVLAVLRYQIYVTVRILKSRLAGFLIIWLIMMLYIGGTLAIVTFMPLTFAIKVPFAWAVVLVSLATALACWLVLHVHDKNFTPMAFMAIIIGAMTIFRLWWQETKFIPAGVMGAIVVIITAIALVVYGFWMRHAVKSDQE